MISLNENQKKLILAFLIAVLLWGYASNQTDSIFNYGDEQTASFILDLETRNLAEEYEVESISVEKAVVRINYVSYFSQIVKEDVKAYLDLRNVMPGDNMKIIEVNIPQSAKLLSVDPGYAVVKISKKND